MVYHRVEHRVDDSVGEGRLHYGGAPITRLGDHLGTHTLCAIVNDERVYERLARPNIGPKLPTTSENVLPRFTGGQVVAGSNPVSPTKKNAL